MSALDLFAGPGGWEAETTDLVRPIGIEHDASACLTRAAAGHLTIRADVRTLEPARFRPLEGLIASPPCPTFSAAGGRAGIAELRYLIAHVHACVTGWKSYDPPEFADWRPCVEHRWYVDGLCNKCVRVPPDPRSALVLEPLRFALECVPTWIALEQVPDVLPVWEAMQYVLRANGWSVWCGILNSADFGVPQTRRRAILMAHRKREVQPPAPTHCEGGASTIFGELLPWVSMAEALGWDGFDARYQRGAGLTERHGERPDRACEEPAPTLTGSALGAGAGAKLGLVLRTGANTMKHGRTADDIEPYERSMDRPAPVVDAKAGSAWAFERPAPTLVTTRRCEEGILAGRQLAPGENRAVGGWGWERPATTVAADPRLGEPGHRDREGGERQFATDALRLTETDALRLQSFPGDYPIQGTKTKRFEQIGNAIPPVLARAILCELAPRYLTREKQG